MIHALMGGALIGIAVSIMLLFNGRVTGISGIISGVLPISKNDFWWRISFILGLLSGGFILNTFYGQSLTLLSSANFFDYAFTGLLVGYGTLLGSGCTSGHGVCGISRLSLRSIFSTLIFISFGILSLMFFKFIRGTL
jgi:uncharacterized membrane protein YedE/YeeE